MRTVDSEAYKLPTQHDSLNGSYRLRFDLQEQQGFFSDLPQAAQELGFVRMADFSTKETVWQIYDRPDHPVPNFPDGETTISSTLALYAPEQGYSRALLRASTKSYYPWDEWMEDLDAFTRHFVERPRLLGFPSKAMTDILIYPAAALGGVILGGAAAYLTTSPELWTNATYGTTPGAAIAVIISGFLHNISERYARKQISDLTQYFGGDNARNVLYGEKRHRITVEVQKELYAALQKEGVSLEPDQFLENIYGQLPSSLVLKRHAEIEQAKHPDHSYAPSETGNTLPKLTQIARVLSTA